MANDPDAKSTAISFEGGTVVMTFGMIKSLFVDTNEFIDPPGEDVSVSVKSHTRTRVIGGASTPVAA